MTNRFQLFAAGAVAAVILAGCGDTSTPLATTSVPATATSIAPQTTVAATTTAPTTTTAPSALDALGYPVSNDYVVETVVSGIDSGTGGLAVDNDGILYQADFGYSGHPGNRVYRIDLSGDVETFAEDASFVSLTMTTFGADGELYQASYGSDKVFKISPDGVAELVADGIEGPTGIVALADGTLFVEAYDSGILHKVLPDGTVTDWAVNSGFNGINGLAIGPDGTLYAANHRDGGLFAIDQEGAVTELHRFPGPTSHVAYLDGSLFVTSRANYVVYRYDLDTAIVEIVAGNAEPGDQDGRGAESSFGRPNAITVGPDDVLYFNHGGDGTNEPVTIRTLTRRP